MQRYSHAGDLDPLGTVLTERAVPGFWRKFMRALDYRDKSAFEQPKAMPVGTVQFLFGKYNHESEATK